MRYKDASPLGTSNGVDRYLATMFDCTDDTPHLPLCLRADAHALPIPRSACDFTPQKAVDGTVRWVQSFDCGQNFCSLSKQFLSSA